MSILAILIAFKHTFKTNNQRYLSKIDVKTHTCKAIVCTILQNINPVFPDRQTDRGVYFINTIDIPTITTPANIASLVTPGVSKGKVGRTIMRIMKQIKQPKTSSTSSQRDPFLDEMLASHARQGMRLLLKKYSSHVQWIWINKII